ncbi:putative actin patch assembly and actin polymerization protein [Puccinia graminis f. sp. tritici]|uniref:Putative actin patch assembly and actin polymerization protein n=1 Tax=Puccinia graminis f. sp. tritici TaxID=56615 RepID=A0A5B0MDQ9_PUCGR|nr:putative actin patch assembly and actin polymerization protein [Puccinia graminis f. sp. tritici]KAA1090485.1 putative actin patch assembly and actin polymerization protein [Puccinia graminis f. sp. tritici]
MPSLFSDPTKAKELFTKPQTAVTDWIERICDPNRDSAQNDLNGFIIELVESINLQPTGPEEASRAIRKQLKHGRPTQQAKALTILEALVLNGGSRFKSTFADARLVECFKGLVSDPRTDSKVRRRLLIMMEDWEKAYGSDANMIVAASLFKTCGGRAKLEKLSPSSSSTQRKTSTQRSMITGIEKPPSTGLEPTPSISKAQLKMQKKQDKKRKEKLKSSPIDQRYRTELVLPASDSSSLLAFDLIKEKPRILQAVASASQSANNLVNRLQLIGPDQVARDLTVGGLVEKAKASQKALIRYIQIVSEHDSEGEYLGTLLNTNAQVVTALELYEDLSQSKPENSQVDRLADRLTKAKVTTPQPTSQSEPNLFDDQNYAVDTPAEHPASPAADLLGLDFNQTALMDGRDNLPAPLVPNSVGGTREAQPNYEPGTLSDYSDFDDSASSSDDTTEETTGSTKIPPPTTNNPFHQYLAPTSAETHPSLSSDLDQKEPLDPFADPFADTSASVAATHNSLITSRVV